MISFKKRRCRGQENCFQKVIVLILEYLLSQVLRILKFSLYANNGLQKMDNKSQNKDLEPVLEIELYENR